MDDAARFFGPFGANEMFTTALLGWGIQTVAEARAAFLDAIAAKADSSSEAEGVRGVVSALRDADDIVATVESYATVGNIDLAVFSRRANTVLLVEHKTGSGLGKLQITKYLLAMRAADPVGDRRLAAVLLRPKKTAPGDENADPAGVESSCKVTHADLSRVFASIRGRLTNEVVGENVLTAALGHVFPKADAPTVGEDYRSELLDDVAAAAASVGWRTVGRSPQVLKLGHPALGAGHVVILVNPDAKSMLWCQINGSERRIRPATQGPPTHVFDLWPGCRSFSFPSPFPGHRWDKPWIGDRPEERARQVRVAVEMLARLPSYLGE